MNPEQTSLKRRLLTALLLPWRVISDIKLAVKAQKLLDYDESVVTRPVEIKPSSPPPPDYSSALQLLRILQREGRFIDFLQEDLSDFPDEDVGAAARVVHEGCQRALRDYLHIESLRKEEEGDVILLQPGFDPNYVQLTGNVGGEPPFQGHLAHHGWQVKEIKLPRLSEDQDPTILAAAEVEM